MIFENTLSFARKMDEQDPLHHFRDRFHIPQAEGKDSVYFVGNSLGLQPKTTKEYVNRELDDWAKFGVEGHFHARKPWLSYHEQFPSLLSKIIGCKEEEVIVMNQLTVNIHLLMVTFYRPTAKRFRIICEEKSFPSDMYALESQVRVHGLDPAEAIVEVAPRKGEHTIRTEDILATIKTYGDETALVFFEGVHYYTGQLFDIPAITKAAHAAGAYAGFDLAHAAGNVKLQLHDWDVDFACWCSYKYMNSGPGGVAGAYIHERFAKDTSLPRFAGWWGHTKETRFQMEKGFEAIPTAEGWQLSNAPILSMAAHKASLDVFDEAGMDALIAKSKLLSNYLLFILDDINSRQTRKIVELITPRSENEKGCQVSMLMLEKGKEVFNALMEQGVMSDWREPNVIRIAAVPLYNTFEDIYRFGNIIQSILDQH
jgi:kynureninase